MLINALGSVTIDGMIWRRFIGEDPTMRRMDDRCRRIRSWTCVVILSMCGAAGSYAGQGTWTSGGPYGGSVRALAIDPGTPATLYAGTAGGGVFKSGDAGSTWSAANSGLTNPNVRALAIDPVTPATIYAGTTGGVFKSTDGGDTWAAANTGLTGTFITALAIDPTTPATLYAATGTGGVFKSTNSGGTWTAANTGLTNLRRSRPGHRSRQSRHALRWDR